MNNTINIDFAHADIAPSYGKFNKESIQNMDDGSKIMIAGAMKALVALSDKSWPSVSSAMMQNPILEPSGDVHSSMKEKQIKPGGSTTWLGSATPSGVATGLEYQTWFNELVQQDNDVISGTNIDISKIVAHISAGFEAKHAHPGLEKPMVDIGVLQFPDNDREYFKLYRVQLKAWSECTRGFLGLSEKNGIIGEFHSRMFKPRTSVIDAMSVQARENAVGVAYTLFDD